MRRRLLTHLSLQAFSPRGFSVVEIILAAAIFLLFSSAAVFVTLQGFDANRTGNEKTIANEYASEGIEAARSIRDQSYSNLVDTNGGTAGVVQTGGLWTFGGTSNTFGKYTRTITVTDVYRDSPDSSGNIVDHTACSCGTIDANTKKVTSTVIWNVTPARQDTVSQSVYLTNWQAPIAWYDHGYAFKKMITIDPTKVSGGSDLGNYPVLISFTDPDLIANSSGGNCSGNSGCVQSSSGYDIIFTDSTQTSKLDHEIEKYVPSTGEIEMWVRIPTLSTSVNTVIYLYYDNSSVITSQENIPGVWNSNYMGVWHLNETSGLHNDSSANANNSTSVSVTKAGSAVGKIDGADKFTGGSGNNVTIPTSASLLPASMTLQTWLKLNSIPTANNYTLLVKNNSSGTPNWNSYVLYVNTSGQVCFSWINTSGTNYTVCGNTVLTTGTWYNAAGIYNGSSVSIYLNGTNDTGGSIATSGTILLSNSDFIIGQSNASYTPDAIIDEPRILNKALGSAWLTTDYNNQNTPSTFYAVSSAMGQ